MEKITKNTIVAFIIIALIIGGYFYGKSQAKTNIEYREVEKFVKITQKQVDSIQALVEPKEIVVTKYVGRIKELKEEEKEIVYDEEECKEIVDNLKEQIANQDTIIVHKDSIIYLEKEVIKLQKEIIEKKVLPKNQKWSIGVQVGYGTNNFEQYKPYFGVGLTRTIIRL